MRHQTCLVFSLVLFALAGCGGGNESAPSGTGNSAGFTLAPIAIKTFRFSWPIDPDATSYRLLENPDGASGFVPIADTTENAFDHLVPLHLRSRARYLLQSCSGGTCLDREQITVSGNLVPAIGYLKASNTGENDYFGAAVALSGDGNTLAVSAPEEDAAFSAGQSDDSLRNSGAVYIFVRDGNTWRQQAYLKARNADIDDFFGSSLALSHDGNILAVGAPNEDADPAKGESDNSFSNSGAVYLFTRSAGRWQQSAYLKAPGSETGFWFGYRVALSADGRRLAASAPLAAIQANPRIPAVGAIHVFERDTFDNWTETAILRADNPDNDDALGMSLALSADGNTLAAGSWKERSAATGINGNGTDNSATWAGAAYIFVYTNGGWMQQAYIKASNTDAYDGFAFDLALSGNGDTLAVAARDEDSSSRTINGPEDNNDALQSGAVYIFNRNGAQWSQQAYLKAPDASLQEWFGHRVSLSADGNLLAVAAYYDSSNADGIGGNALDTSTAMAGAVHVFLRTTGNWSHSTFVKASNSDGFDLFGSAVALSADGETLAVGAAYEQGSAKGIMGNQSDNNTLDAGAVYLY